MADLAMPEVVLVAVLQDWVAAVLDPVGVLEAEPVEVLVLDPVEVLEAEPVWAVVAALQPLEEQAAELPRVAE